MPSKSHEPIHWTLNQIAEETGCARQTVKNKMVRANIEAAPDHTYTTKQMIAALFGDIEAEKLRLAKADADMREMERDEMAARLIPADVVQTVWQDALTNLKSVATTIDIPKSARKALLDQLRDIPISDYTEAALPTDDEDTADEP